MTPTVGKLSLASAISALLLIFISCRPNYFYFTKLEVGPDLHLVPSGRVSAEPSIGSYYFFFHTATGLTTVDHFQKKPGGDTRERLLYLETDRNQVLDRTVKSEEILKGRFGTVYAEKTCFFARPIASSSSYVSVYSYFNQLDHEVPSELSHPPQHLPPLTSLSLVRIFHADPEYLVVSANYEPNGELGSLHIDGAKGGDWLHSNFVPAAQDGFVQRVPKDRGSDALKKYGIPAHLDVQEYLRSHRLSLSPVALSQEMTVMNQHYGYNKLIRQDELKDGDIILSRFLQPSVTDEENALDSLCESRFHQQQTLGLPTVE
jgi:hypothetical protein